MKIEGYLGSIDEMTNDGRMIHQMTWETPLPLIDATTGDPWSPSVVGVVDDVEVRGNGEIHFTATLNEHSEHMDALQPAMTLVEPLDIEQIGTGQESGVSYLRIAGRLRVVTLDTASAFSNASWNPKETR